MRGSRMELHLPREQAARMRDAVHRGGVREVGGQLFGEQMAPSEFRVMQVTVQARRGTVARFVVDVLQAGRDALAFFRRTRHEYRRFNYIGEWHSHPLFALIPSDADVATMRGLVSNPTFRGTFAVLMIVKVVPPDLISAAWVFAPDGREPVNVRLDT